VIASSHVDTVAVFQKYFPHTCGFCGCWN